MVQLCFVLTHHWHFSFHSQTWRNLLMLLSPGLIIVKCLVVISANCSKLLCAASRLLWPHYPNPSSLSLSGLAVLENRLTWLTFPPGLATTRLPFVFLQLLEESSGHLVQTFSTGWLVIILVMPSLTQIFESWYLSCSILEDFLVFLLKRKYCTISYTTDEIGLIIFSIWWFFSGTWPCFCSLHIRKSIYYLI